MICGKCGTEAELKQFNSFQYWYCKTCKDEASAYQAQDKQDSDLRKYGVVVGDGFPMGNGNMDTWSANQIIAFVRTSNMRKEFNSVALITYTTPDNKWLDISKSIEVELDLEKHFCSANNYQLVSP